MKWSSLFIFCYIIKYLILTKFKIHTYEKASVKENVFYSPTGASNYWTGGGRALFVFGLIAEHLFVITKSVTLSCIR